MIEDLLPVDIELGHNMNFVIMEGPQNRYFLYGRERYKRHEDEVAAFVSMLREKGMDPLHFRCAGGGFLCFYAGEHSLEVFGSSKDYDGFDAPIVKKLLEEYIEREHLVGLKLVVM